MKKPIKIALLSTGLAVVLVLVAPQIYISYDDYSVRHQGEEAAKRIDAFELKEGHVPVNLEEIGESSTRLNYHASGPHQYTIRYMDWISARRVFNPNTRKWEFVR